MPSENKLRKEGIMPTENEQREEAILPSKNELRKEARNRKRQFSGLQLRELSLPIIDRLLENPRLAVAKTVMLYCSLPDEVYTMDAIHQLHAEGKNVVLPVVISDTDMEIRVYESDNDLRKGSFDIMEPCGPLFTDYEKIDLIVCPGMGFDKNGNRLGRGKGYYDRFLDKVYDKYKIGVCFAFQLFNEIPTNEHDIKMNEVIAG